MSSGAKARIRRAPRARAVASSQTDKNRREIFGSLEVIPEPPRNRRRLKARQDGIGGTRRWSQNRAWSFGNPCFSADFAQSRHRGRESHSLRHSPPANGVRSCAATDRERGRGAVAACPAMYADAPARFQKHLLRRRHGGPKVAGDARLFRTPAEALNHCVCHG
jgi:hypothetical protein